MQVVRSACSQICAVVLLCSASFRADSPQSWPLAEDNCLSETGEDETPHLEK